jgi:preprotein translocase subunit SecB
MAQDKVADKEATDRKTGQFSIQKVYVKDMSFETPNSPQIFQQQWQPQVNKGALYEVVLSITVTVSFEKQTVYLVEVQQAGIFHVSGLPPEAMDRMLATVCPNILFPFAREVVADIVTRGGFPQLLLAPVNFDALYLQQQNRKVAN